MLPVNNPLSDHKSIKSSYKYRATMDHVNASLVKNLNTHFIENGIWDRFSNDSNTQNDERNYIKIILEIIRKMGGKIGSLAPSQQSKDIRNVMFACVSHPITYECKKSKGRFILNDTMPNNTDDYYYIFINTNKRTIVIKHSTEISGSSKYLNDNITKEMKMLYMETMNKIENAVNAGYMSYHDYGQLFKQTKLFPDGVTSRPRPNWSIKI